VSDAAEIASRGFILAGRNISSKDSACLTYFERVAGKACPMLEGKIDMAARRQVTNKLQVQYRRASKADKTKVLDRVVATTS
jgi:hypothetical protein